jgi:hypothetical protein
VTQEPAPGDRLPPAGWYPQGDQERWWNGSSWSDSFRPIAPGAPGVPSYGQPGYGQPYYAAPQQKSNVGRNVLLGCSLVLVLLIASCGVGIAVLASRVDDSASDDTPGGPNNPLTITEGVGFQVAGFEYAAGWAVTSDELGDADITGLRVTNDRSGSDSAFVEVRLLQGSTVAATLTCTSGTVEVGATADLGCTSLDDLPASWDRITIRDSF